MILFYFLYRDLHTIMIRIQVIIVIITIIILAEIIQDIIIMIKREIIKVINKINIMII